MYPGSEAPDADEIKEDIYRFIKENLQIDKNDSEIELSFCGEVISSFTLGDCN